MISCSLEGYIFNSQDSNRTSECFISWTKEKWVINMGKLAQNYAKYMVYATMKASGIVEKPDVIGAVFGQTEGLLGDDLDLRELQRTGRLGRIEVNIKKIDGESEAEIIIPSSLDASETSLIASSLETIDKVGPCEAKITVNKVEDVRSNKRRYVVDRAKEIMQTMSNTAPEGSKLADMIKDAVRTCEVEDYHGLSCGPDIESSDEIIVVEGRADVINLLKSGIRNVIAIEGSKIPDALIELTKEKTTTAFVDGDRGGMLDLKKLLTVANIDYVVRAEEGYEVEDLSKKQIHKTLREKIPIESLDIKELNEEKSIFQKKEEINSVESSTYISNTLELDDDVKEKFSEMLESIVGSRAAFLLGENNEVIVKIPLSELSVMLDEYTGTKTIIIDIKANQELIDVAIQKKIKQIVASASDDGLKIPSDMTLIIAAEL